MTDPLLAERFDTAMHELYVRIVRECDDKYHPTRFHGMLETYGGVETAHRLLRDPNYFSYGFERLCELDRPDLTIEAMILSLSYRRKLFTAEELSAAAERLAIAKDLAARQAAVKTRRQPARKESRKRSSKKRPAT